MAAGRIYALQETSFSRILVSFNVRNRNSWFSRRRWSDESFQWNSGGDLYRFLLCGYRADETAEKGSDLIGFQSHTAQSQFHLNHESTNHEDEERENYLLSTSNLVWLMVKGSANNSRQKCIGMKCNQYLQFNELVISELLQQNTKKIKYQTTFGSMQLVGDIRIIAPKSQIPKYRNTFGWMLYVDSIIITICRNGTDHHHHQDQDRPVSLSTSFWNISEHISNLIFRDRQTHKDFIKI